MPDLLLNFRLKNEGYWKTFVRELDSAAQKAASVAGTANWIAQNPRRWDVNNMPQGYEVARNGAVQEINGKRIVGNIYSPPPPSPLQKAAGVASSVGSGMGLMGVAGILGGTMYGAWEATKQGSDLERQNKAAQTLTGSVRGLREEVTNLASAYAMSSQQANDFARTLMSSGAYKGRASSLTADVQAVMSTHASGIVQDPNLIAGGFQSRGLLGGAQGGTSVEQNNGYLAILQQAVTRGGMDGRNDEVVTAIQNLTKTVTEQGTGAPGAFNGNFASMASLLQNLGMTGNPLLQGQYGAQQAAAFNQTLTSGRSPIAQTALVEAMTAGGKPFSIGAYNIAKEAGLGGQYNQEVAQNILDNTGVSKLARHQGETDAQFEQRKTEAMAVFAPGLGLKSATAYSYLAAQAKGVDPELQKYLKGAGLEGLDPSSVGYAVQAREAQHTGADMHAQLQDFLSSINKDGDSSKYTTNGKTTGAQLQKALTDNKGAVPLGDFQTTEQKAQKVVNDFVNAGAHLTKALNRIADMMDIAVKALGIALVLAAPALPGLAMAGMGAVGANGLLGLSKSVQTLGVRGAANIAFGGAGTGEAVAAAGGMASLGGLKVAGAAGLPLLASAGRTVAKFGAAMGGVEVASDVIGGDYKGAALTGGLMAGGAAIGSAVPGVGTLAGAGVGYALAKLVSLVSDHWNNDRGKTSDSNWTPQQRATNQQVWDSSKQKPVPGTYVPAPTPPAPKKSAMLPKQGGSDVAYLDLSGRESLSAKLDAGMPVTPYTPAGALPPTGPGTDSTDWSSHYHHAIPTTLEKTSIDLLAKRIADEFKHQGIGLGGGGGSGSGGGSTAGGASYGGTAAVGANQKAIAGSINDWVTQYAKDHNLSAADTQKLQQLELFTGGMESGLTDQQNGSGGARGTFQFDPHGGQAGPLQAQYGEAGFHNPQAQLNIFNQQGLVEKAWNAYNAVIKAGGTEAAARQAFWEAQEAPNHEQASSRNASEGGTWWNTAGGLTGSAGSGAQGASAPAGAQSGASVIRPAAPTSTVTPADVQTTLYHNLPPASINSPYYQMAFQQQADGYNAAAQRSAAGGPVTVFEDTPNHWVTPDGTVVPTADVDASTHSNDGRYVRSHAPPPPHGTGPAPAAPASTAARQPVNASSAELMSRSFSVRVSGTLTVNYPDGSTGSVPLTPDATGYTDAQTQPALAGSAA